MLGFQQTAFEASKETFFRWAFLLMLNNRHGFWLCFNLRFILIDAINVCFVSICSINDVGIQIDNFFRARNLSDYVDGFRLRLGNGFPHHWLMFNRIIFSDFLLNQLFDVRLINYRLLMNMRMCCFSQRNHLFGKHFRIMFEMLTAVVIIVLVHQWFTGMNNIFSGCLSGNWRVLRFDLFRFSDSFQRRCFFVMRLSKLYNLLSKNFGTLRIGTMLVA